MREILLVRFGEVFLKGQNRPFFMKKLMDHIRQAVRPVNGRVWMSEGRFYVSDFTDMDECIRRVTRGRVRRAGIGQICEAKAMRDEDEQQREKRGAAKRFCAGAGKNGGKKTAHNQKLL